MHAHFATGLLAASAPLVLALNLGRQTDADPSVWADSTPGAKRAAPRLARPDPVAGTSPNPAKRQGGWSPPSELATPLKEVWDHCVDTYSGGLFGFTNYGWDQLRANDG